MVSYRRDGEGGHSPGEGLRGTYVCGLRPRWRPGSVCDDDAGGWRPHILWRNNGNSTFTDISEETALGVAATGAGVVATDFNNDRAIDLLWREERQELPFI